MHMRESELSLRQTAGLALFVGSCVTFTGITSLELAMITSHQEQVDQLIDHLPLIRELGRNPRLLLEGLTAAYSSFYAIVAPSWKLAERLMEPPGGWINSHRKLTQ